MAETIINNHESLLKEIERYAKEDKVVIATLDGLKVISIKKLLNQSVEGVLYDLNRDLATLITKFKNTANIKYINDIAMANVLKYMYNQQSNH